MVSDYEFNPMYRNCVVIADDYRIPLMIRYKNPDISFSKVYGNTTSLDEMNQYLSKNFPRKTNIYMFFGTTNIFGNSVIISNTQGVNLVDKEYKSLNNLFSIENKIYDNNGSQVYFRG